jgi:hypothetical protein
MKITFDPANLDGAARYIVKKELAPDLSRAKDWIEQAVVKKFTDRGAKTRDFEVIYRGIGFYWSTVGYTNSPSFSKEVSSTELPDLVEVTFWVVADAVA